MSNAIYTDLARFIERPAPFSAYTTDRLWTDPHIARQMLRFHLDDTNDAASRRRSKIESFVGWLDARLGLRGRRILDLGCGPGLYTERMARRGAHVTGLDFSQGSLAHARHSAAEQNLEIRYVAADYHRDPLPGPAEIVTLIYGDYCAMGPASRSALLASISACLVPGGRFVLDLFPPAMMAGIAPRLQFSYEAEGGFWSEGPHFVWQQGFHYVEQAISLDRYLVATAAETFEIYNWMQYFTSARIAAELGAAGFLVEGPFAFETGEDWPDDGTPFVMMARR